jgi:hypothetical protein
MSCENPLTFTKTNDEMKERKLVARERATV